MLHRALSLLLFVVLSLSIPSQAGGFSYLTDPKQLSDAGAQFTWEEARSKSIEITVQHSDSSGTPRQTRLGSGFLISPDGLFITAYHVVKYCLENRKERVGLSAGVNCSAQYPTFRYRAIHGNREFEFEVVSHLRKEDSTNGGDIQTPDEIIKHRDFVIGRLKAASQARFPYWRLKDFGEGKIDLANPRANFELLPMTPPKKVFIAGYPGKRDFTIAHGFLNLSEQGNRGYFAADLKLYEPAYLQRQGIPPDTKWGIGVENKISGGAVIDISGSIIGLIVNGDYKTAGILSIENVLETFFSRSAVNRARPAVFLTPTQTPLYLRHEGDRLYATENSSNLQSRP